MRSYISLKDKENCIWFSLFSVYKTTCQFLVGYMNLNYSEKLTTLYRHQT